MLYNDNFKLQQELRFNYVDYTEGFECRMRDINIFQSITVENGKIEKYWRTRNKVSSSQYVSRKNEMAIDRAQLHDGG
ncbi:hypothetical protein RIF29_16287 [Crotalaria pallida]|uniref:Uncharacterized protein n=1 Tax=Crotalaria pallida TaxID=3830 RepID=A0AAN9FNG0_CROPI